MSPPVPPQGDYTELSQLAARISQHLLKHPRDSQARQDLHYVVTQMQGPSGATAAANAEERATEVGPETAHPAAAVAAGVTQAALDIPRGILQSVATGAGRRQAIGQLTGVGNWAHVGETFRDPEANWAEKVDAVARAVPVLNIGYIPERGLLEATGAKADTPASLQEQAHRVGNMASFLLPIVGPKLIGRVAGKIPVIGPAVRAAGAAMRRGAPGPTPVKGLLGVGEDIGTSAQRIPPSVPPPPDPLDIATFLRRDAAARVPAAEVPASAAAPAPTGWTAQAALRWGVKPENVPAFLARQGPAVTPPPPSPMGLLGQPAIPGRPDLGLLAPAGPYQTAGSPLRTVTRSAPMAGPLGTGSQIALQIQLARAMGMTEQAIAARLARLGITPRQVQAALH